MLAFNPNPRRYNMATQHTPGALRAAELIENLRHNGMSDVDRYAAIIDRETAAPKLLRALKNILR